MRRQSTKAKVTKGGTVVGVAAAHTVIIENFYAGADAPAATQKQVAKRTISPCPYRGLSYFGPADSRLFFGRDRAIVRLVEAVSKHDLTALVGASGSGKSSVVLAGLAPRLAEQGNWRFTHFRVGLEPDKNPFMALARALVPLFAADLTPVERVSEVEKLARKLEAGEVTLTNVLAQCRSQNPGKRILLIADQFEEVLTLVPEGEGRQQRFIDLLLSGFASVDTSKPPEACLILTLRADFYGRAVRYRPLSDALQDRIENLGPMSREELQDAIVRPAGKVTYEEGLVETILDDVANRPGNLPLLQFALREMWLHQEDGVITHKAYQAIGGVEGALAKRTEEKFAALTKDETDQQAVALFRHLFTRLVTLGEGVEDTRRVVDRKELGEEAWALAQHLAGEENRTRRNKSDRAQ